MRTRLRKGLHLRCCLSCVLILSVNGICSDIVTAGYQTIVARDVVSCNSLNGVWIPDCCIACENNKDASGAVILENILFSNITSAVLSSIVNSTSKFSLLPGVYQGADNCGINVPNYASRMIGVCGALYTSINCNNSLYHFKVMGYSFELNGLTLINGFNADNGGCVSMMTPGAVLMLTDSKLIHCISYQNGGAINMNNVDMSQQSQSASVSITGKSSIENCSAKLNGGALYLAVGSM